MGKLLSFLLSLLPIISGCTHWISEPSLAVADRSITFSQLRQDPDAYRGKLVLLGGVVAVVTHSREETLLEVVEYRLDSRELPDQVVPSRGRFLATTHGFLDPTRYKPGALVTMMGEVAGKQLRQQRGEESAYPVIDIREIHAIELPEIHPEYDYGDRHHLFHVW